MNRVLLVLAFVSLSAIAFAETVPRQDRPPMGSVARL